MAVKTDRMEARVSPEERERIERAASASGLSVSAFMVSAAADRAEEVIAATTTTRHGGRPAQIFRRGSAMALHSPMLRPPRSAS